jgi:sugar (pentulose or hexulose) kinase
VPAPLIQLRADLFGSPVVIGQNAEASGAGAAALAGVAAGSFANLREASQAVAAPEHRIEPSAGAHDRAMELLGRFGELSVAAGESGAGRRED